jgi:hypothetical protein
MSSCRHDVRPFLIRPINGRFGLSGVLWTNAVQAQHQQIPKLSGTLQILTWPHAAGQNSRW